MKRIALAQMMALGLVSVAAEPALAAPSPERICEVPEGWEEIAAQTPRFVVFGESHGTKEAPAFVGQLLCALAQRGEKVLLATELSAPYNDELQAAWASPIADFPSVLSSWDWQNREDGVASQAMFELLSLARRLKEDGFKVGVTAFNGAKDDKQAARFADIPGQGAHEAAQAQNIYDAAEAGGFARVIVLVGNLHARKTVTSVGAYEIEPMAIKLARKGPTITLDHRHASGTHWGCQLRPDFDHTAGKPVTAKDVQCASHPARGWEDDGRASHLALGPFRDEPENSTFDGYFWVGPVTASPPAIQAATREAP